MRRLLSSISAIVMTISVLTGAAAAQSPYISGSDGVDVSYPNCSATIPKVAFGIVGVNNGTVYSTNPCLSSEAGHFATNLSLYANTGWYNKSTFINPNSPKACAAGDNKCLAYNYGYNAGVYAYNAATAAGNQSKIWWLDVETMNTWNSDVSQNQNSIQGEYNALVDKSATTIGAYSTTAQWQTITGNWKNGWPNWGATTWNNANQAQTYCTGHQFTGGPSLLMQYQNKRSSLDQDVAC
ncbi:MAG TPA: hypothetical protein VLF79_01920 [Candidatus Saccharimonadales bacterium]|nr:hypothetical protein [Candidatus Saccharimonadales bacterium]